MYSGKELFTCALRSVSLPGLAALEIEMVNGTWMVSGISFESHVVGIGSRGGEVGSRGGEVGTSALGIWSDHAHGPETLIGSFLCTHDPLIGSFLCNHDPLIGSFLYHLCRRHRHGTSSHLGSSFSLGQRRLGAATEAQCSM